MTSQTAPGLGSGERTKVAYLSETDLFQDMDARDLEQLERGTAMTTCQRGTVFYTPGETGEVLFILKQGRVNLYRMTAEGKKLVTATVEPGTVFGEMSMIGQGMVDSFAEAAADCTLCVMSRTDVERLIREHPSVSLRLLELLATRLDAAEERLADVAYKSVPARIAITQCDSRATTETPSSSRTRTSRTWSARTARPPRASSTNCARRD
jgi:CRP-like cAMP-binding protein